MFDLEHKIEEEELTDLQIRLTALQNERRRILKEINRLGEQVDTDQNSEINIRLKIANLEYEIIGYKIQLENPDDPNDKQKLRDNIQTKENLLNTQLQLLQQPNQNQQLKLLERIDNNINEILTKPRSKAASQLSGEDYNAIGIAMCNFNVLPKSNDSLRNLLIQKLNDILNLHLQTPTADEKTVRNIMDSFFVDAVKLFLPDTVVEDQVNYCSNLALPNCVKGSIDQLFYFKDTNLPLFNVEHKAFTVNLVKSYAPEVAQTSAEVIAMCEQIQKSFGFIAKEYIGILTNGKVWIAVRRIQVGGIILNQHCPPINAFESDSSSNLIISNSGVDKIVALLLHSFEVAKTLITSSGQQSTNTSTSIVREDEHGSDEEDPDNTTRKRSRKRKASNPPGKLSKQINSSNTSTTKKRTKDKNSTENIETMNYSILSDWNLNIHLRNPGNINENRSMQRFIYSSYV